MNYRHAFHAGNFADAFKHALLARMLVYLAQKPQALRFIDSHAGTGGYDLASDESARTGEWRGGIGRVLASGAPDDVAALLRPWLDAIGPAGDDGAAAFYPGSPLLAARLLRPQDRLALNELHEADFRALRKQLGADARVRIANMDGYQALLAWTPPVERRGLILIDPPFEERDEFARLAAAVPKAWKKWPTGCFAIWYPCKDTEAVADLYQALTKAGISRVLRLEYSIGKQEDLGPLLATGMCVINPPFPLFEEARVLLPWLASTLADPGKGSWRAEWAAGEPVAEPAAKPKR